MRAKPFPDHRKLQFDKSLTHANIFIYLFDETDERKRTIAEQLVNR